MVARAEFTIVFAPETVHHLDVIERKFHGLIRRVIEERLRHTPDVVTRNRKPLEQPGPFGATWQLRCGARNRFRVFYEVDVETQTVSILAVGSKEGSRLRIGREVLES